MSSVPGMQFRAFYYDTDCSIIYSAEKGDLCTWDTQTYKVSESNKTLKLSYGTYVYWSPINARDCKSDTITISVVDKSGNKLKEKKVNIISDDSFYFTVKSDLNIISENNF